MSEPYGARATEMHARFFTAAAAAAGWRLHNGSDHGHHQYVLRYRRDWPDPPCDAEVELMADIRRLRFTYNVLDDPLALAALAPLTAHLDDPHCGAWFEVAVTLSEAEAAPDVLWDTVGRHLECWIAVVEGFRAGIPRCGR